jgi:exodeoxyribonuclease V gamma subunit
VLNSIQNSNGPESGLFTYYAGKETIYKYSPAAESHRHLEKLLDLYWQGLTKPLYFFPRTSFAFAQEIHNGKNEREALRKACIEWEGNDFNKMGEKNDPYNLICCKNMALANPLFTEQAKNVFLTALAHQRKHNPHELHSETKSR